MEEIPLCSSSDTYEKVEAGDAVSTSHSTSSFEVLEESDADKEPVAQKTQIPEPITDSEYTEISNLLGQDMNNSKEKRLNLTSPEILMNELKNSNLKLPLKTATNTFKLSDVKVEPKTEKFINSMFTSETEIKKEHLIEIKPLTPLEKKKKTKYEINQEKKQKRLVRNRMSAQIHREKKKQESMKVEQQLNVVKSENTLLHEKLLQFDQILEENALLKADLEEKIAENENLKAELSKLRELEIIQKGDLFADFTEKEMELEPNLESSNGFFSMFWGDGSDEESVPNSSASVTSLESDRKRKRNTRMKKKNKKQTPNLSSASKVMLFAFTFLFSFMDFEFGFRAEEHAKFSLKETEEATQLNLLATDSKDVILYGKQEIQLSMTENIDTLVLQRLELEMETNDDLLYLPVEKSKMMSSALTLSVSSKELIPHESTALTLEFDDVWFKKQLWIELSRLNDVLQSRSYISEGESLRELSPWSQAVTVYNRDKNTSAKAKAQMEAIETAVVTYMQHLKGEEIDEELKNHNFILCPSAYGLLYDLTSSLDSLKQKVTSNSTELMKPRLRSATGEKMNRKELLELGKSPSSSDEYVNSSALMKDYPQLTLVIPSTTAGSSEGDKQSLLELTCRVETVNEIIGKTAY